MKCKMDFVTNSSSTSFTAWGISLAINGEEGEKTKRAIYKKCIENKTKDEDPGHRTFLVGPDIDIQEEDLEDFDLKENMDSIVKGGLDYHSNHDDNEILIGICPTMMKDHETLMLFKMRIARTIKEQLGIEVTEKDINWQEYCGYNG